MTKTQTPATGSGTGPTRSLLDGLMNDTLDPGYAEAAKRRAAAGAPAPARGRARTWLVIGLVLAGLLLAVAYRQTARQAPESARDRQALIGDVDRATRTGDQLQRKVAALTAAVGRDRSAGLAETSSGRAAAGTLTRLEAAAALVPVHGPGIAVTLADAAPIKRTDPVTGQQTTEPPNDTGLVQDRDLQSIVNALWASGAEAVAINGQRLAPTSTIRAAGGAILVDLFPVSSPYTIQAIGEPGGLGARFAGSPTASQFRSYVGLYGLQFATRTAGHLSLPAAADAGLHYARPVPATRTPTKPAPTKRGGH